MDGQAKKQCQYCKSEIDSTTTKCPQCQTDLRWFGQHKILGMLLVSDLVKILVGLVGVLVILVVVLTIISK